MPGLSRSGSTIATGLLLGNKKAAVAQFSFLMVLGSDPGRDPAPGDKRRSDRRYRRRAAHRRIPRIVHHGMSGLQIHDRGREAGQTHLVRRLLHRCGTGVDHKLFLLMKEALDLRGINFEDGYIAVVDKPLRWTSTDVVRKIKFSAPQAGLPQNQGRTRRDARPAGHGHPAGLHRPRHQTRRRPASRGEGVCGRP